MYDNVFGLSVCFTNLPISIHKLRDDDGDWHNRYKNIPVHPGVSIKRKRAESKDKYRKTELAVGHHTTLLGSNYNTQK